nr:urease accessory UreF family protein [Mesorhizobium sp. SP-1A]
MTTTITTAEADGSLLRLTAWLSPVFPVGSFSYSNGLEGAAHDGLVGSAGDLRDWLEDLVSCGSGWNDAVLFAESWRRARDGGDLAELAELAEALAGSAERHMESTLQGAAFLDAAGPWPAEALSALPRACPYCVAVGAACGAHGVALAPALALFLQALCLNLMQAAIRLSVTGQNGVTALLAALEPLLAATAARAAASTLDDLGSATFIADIAAMKHETQHSRLFRS